MYSIVRRKSVLFIPLYTFCVWSCPMIWLHIISSARQRGTGKVLTSLALCLYFFRKERGFHQVEACQIMTDMFWQQNITDTWHVLEAIVLKKVNILYIEFGTSGRSWRQLYYSQMLKWQMMQPWVTILGSSSPTPPPPPRWASFSPQGSNSAD